MAKPLAAHLVQTPRSDQSPKLANFDQIAEGQILSRVYGQTRPFCSMRHLAVNPRGPVAAGSRIAIQYCGSTGSRDAKVKPL